MWLSLRFFLAVALAVSLAGGERLEGEPPPTPDLTAISTEDLISRFQEVSVQSIGAHSLAWAVGFVAIDAPPRFAGGVLGSPPPVPSPIMRELTRRGVAVVPALLDHLSDARPTKLTVGSDENFGFMSAWYSDEYAARDPANPPAGVSKARQESGKELGNFEHHQVKVGDLCFVTLGQIVNRPLAAVRYQPTACLVVNSPLQTPALAAAARADWTGLNAAMLKDLLLKDIAAPEDPDVQTGALQRLLFYYSKDGTELAVRWLNRPLYDTEPVAKLLAGPLLTQDNTKQQDALLEAFQKKNGPVYDQAAAQAVIDTAARFEPGERQPFSEQARRFANADKLARRRFAAGDRHRSPDGRVEECGDQQRVVEALAAFPSAEIDAAVRGLLKRAMDLPLSDTGNQYNQAQLACACARRLCSPERSKEIEQAAEEMRASIPRDGASVKAIATYERLRQNFWQDVGKLLSSQSH